MRTHLREHTSPSRVIRRLKPQPGFTLVEVLVVMVVLALLAAIALPSFYSQRDKASDAEAKQTLTTAQLAAETYAIDNDGRYTGATPAELAQIERTLSGSPLTVLAAGPKTYRLQVVSGSTSVFYLERAAGGTQHSCNPPGTGGCAADGSW